MTRRAVPIVWQVAGKRLFVTIYRRKDTLVVRALNPAAQRETELVLPVQQLPRLLPAELLSEERETDMLKHIANQCVAVGPCVSVVALPLTCMPRSCLGAFLVCVCSCVCVCVCVCVCMCVCVWACVLCVSVLAPRRSTADDV